MERNGRCPVPRLLRDLSMTEHMPNGTTPETFQAMQVNDKLNVLFDYNLYFKKILEEERKSREDNEDSKEEHCSKRWERCNERFYAIENKGHKLIGGLIILNLVVPIAAYFLS